MNSVHFSIVFALVAFGSFSSRNGVAIESSPVERYREAKRIYDQHSQPGFEHDDSLAAIHALRAMWTASADAVIQVLSLNPHASSREINSALCNLEPSADCSETSDGDQVVKLGDGLFLAAQSMEETGTVFVVGLRDGKPALLWSIDEAETQQPDQRGLLAAWKAGNSGDACRNKQKTYDFTRCGPLYASVGLLTPTVNGAPRFYIDAGYAQGAGATIGHQTSVWRWDGTSASLLWIDAHAFMIDQQLGTSFNDGVLSIAEKDEFRTFYSCGSCEARQMLHRLLITPDGVKDLGKTSTTPELDLVDELFWRLAHGRSTSEIASSQVSDVLRPQILDSVSESKKINPHYFTTGMLGATAVTRAGNIIKLCFTADDIGRLYFTLEMSPTSRMTLTHVEQPSGEYGDCPTTKE